MTLTRKQRRFMRFAIRIADSAPLNQRFRVGCVLVKGGIPISFGINMPSKTHPRAHAYKFPYPHAELSALIGVDIEETNGSVAYVARVSPTRKCLGMARPCPVCQEELRKAGVRKALYTTPTGSVEILDL